MNTHKTLIAFLFGIIVCIAPIEAQRPSSGGHGGGGRPSSGSYGGGRPSNGSYGGGYSSSSRHANSVSHSSNSYRGSSQSTSYSKGSTGYSSSRPSSSARSTRTAQSARSAASYGGNYNAKGGRSNNTPSRNTSYTSTRPTSNTVRPGSTYNSPGRGGKNATDHPTQSTRRPGQNYADAPNASHPSNGPRHSYAHPGNPHAPMPPSHRHIRPAPYFHHPIHHAMIHCHPIFWDPLPPRYLYWPGFWGYCHDYWYDYHVRDIVVVKEYVHEKYNTELITYAISGDYMYALTIGDDGKTYIQVFDKEDKLLAEQQVHKKYCIMEIDKDNGGCWLMKKNNKDPLLFFYNDGELLIYEED